MTTMMISRPRTALLSAGLGLAMAVAASAPAAAQAILPPREPARAEASLKETFANDFRVGAALNLDQVYGRDVRARAIAERHFNTISPENLLKWEYAQPERGRYAFEAMDRYVDYGQRHGMFVVGHTLVWHNQTPRWVFEDSAGNPVSRDTLLARLREHIQTVVGRYRGRIGGWDVVNEALEEDGALRQTPWLRIIGPDYIRLAFQYAHEADPQAELYYNDYSLEQPAKRDGAVRLIRELLQAGVPVHAVGLQGHHKLDWPTMAAEDSTIDAFAALGVKVNITELDIDVLPRRGNGAEVTARGPQGCDCRMNPYVTGLPDSLQQALAQRYGDFFAVYKRHADVIDRITFWGVGDADSWLNDWPVRGRTNHPLLFGWRGETKAAFDAVIAAARGAVASSGGGDTQARVAEVWSAAPLQQ
jgi:endo-1,4-beta-xylanase